MQASLWRYWCWLGGQLVVVLSLLSRVAWAQPGPVFAFVKPGQREARLPFIERLGKLLPKVVAVDVLIGPNIRGRKRIGGSRVGHRAGVSGPERYCRKLNEPSQARR
jgi:hypothetical protein